MKKQRRRSWRDQPRPFDDEGREIMREIAGGPDEQLDALFLRDEIRGAQANSVLSPFAIRLLVVIRALEGRGNLPPEAAKDLARRFRLVLDGSTWNEAFDAPWAREPLVEHERRDLEVYVRVLKWLEETRRLRPGATLEEAFSHVADQCDHRSPQWARDAYYRVLSRF